MSASGQRQQQATRQQAAAAGPDEPQAAATPATSDRSGSGTKVTTAAWVPRLKQQQAQQPQSQPAVPEERKAVPSGVHDLASDLLVQQTDSASCSGGKGKNRSKSKKMNWKPLPVPIIRRDPHDRERDIRGSTRKYGFSGMGAAAGGKKQSPAHMTNGFRNSGPHHNNNNNNLSHQVNQNSVTGFSNNGIHDHEGHAVGSSLSSPQTPATAAQSSAEDGKVLRSGSVSSSSSYSRRHHHQQQHHHHQQASHSHAHPDQTPGPTSPAAGGEVTNNHPHNQQQAQQSLSQPARLVNGGTTTTGTSRVSGRPPVLRSAAHSPPASPAHQTHQHRQKQQQHVDQQYGSGRRQAGIRGSTGGSGRATPNSLKDFSSPEVQYFPIDYAALNHESSLMGNKTSGLMSPVLSLPPGTVVVPAPAFAGGTAAVAANSSTSLSFPADLMSLVAAVCDPVCRFVCMLFVT